jgi:adenine-specific DNA-methyltransferase
MKENEAQPISAVTPDIAGDQIELLNRIFPECVTEGQVDFDLLQATLGEADALAEDGAYSLAWAGKEEAFRVIQAPSRASLAPVPEESVNWEESQHLFIEGENLEVLKLLYKSYFGKVKMIYIDPPYNTGNDFIYRDDYSEPRRAYLEKTGQMDPEGNVLKTNPETSGRYHSDWLTMMYPRLFLARQLLREDGVVWISIDDTEVCNLRLLCNEIFGEENFVATFIWEKRTTRENRRVFSFNHDFVLCYARNKELFQASRNLLPLTEEVLNRYSNPDNDPRGDWQSVSLNAQAGHGTPAQFYTITTPSGRELDPPSGRCWVVTKERLQELIEDDRIWFGRDGDNVPRLKVFLSEARQGLTPHTLWKADEVGTTDSAKKDLIDLFSGYAVYETPKPVKLVKRMIRISTDSSLGDIVLDFFGGSCTTAQAVLELNREDKGDRRAMIVQIAEPTPAGSTAREAGFEAISDIGKQRMRRVIARMQEGDDGGQLQLDLRPDEDLGFKVFKLAPSTFRQWVAPEDEDPKALGDQLELFDRGLQEGADLLHVIYEVVLKLGYSLNAAIEPLDLESNRVFKVSDELMPGPSLQEGSEATEAGVTSVLEPADLLVCLDDELHDTTIDALPLDKETTFVCLDAALDDSQKVNLAMACLLKVI